MQVILQEKIKNLGAIGEIVDVKPGYARNYLFRSGKALPANKENVERVMAKRSELEKIEKQKFKEAQKRAETIAAVKTVELQVPTNEEGKLFGSISSAEIVDALSLKGLEVSKQEVSILESPVKSIGQYTVVVQIHPDVAENLIFNLTSSTVESVKTETVDQQADNKESGEDSSVDSDDAENIESVDENQDGE
ncbi:MAG: 50S ribosomal protein L9 [Pseudomonadota bacterium]|nr:50S ribosomal protein L9 [Pseudomonadota bacterium]